jgi:hypothetical protein
MLRLYPGASILIEVEDANTDLRIVRVDYKMNPPAVVVE